MQETRIQSPFRGNNFLKNTFSIVLLQKQSKINKMHIKDVVHGEIDLPNHIMQIMQTPQFLRLQKIKQLGFLYLSRPEATSTRYEHCIGTYWLARKMLDALTHNSSWLQRQNDFNFYRTAVEIAALLHDVGHGPFSHNWENIIENFKHEENARECVISIFDFLSAKMETDSVLKEMVKNNKYGVELIFALISGRKDVFPYAFPSRYNFIFEIVHNEKCKVDVDKWDYLLRDRFYLKDLCNPEMNFGSVFLEARPSEDGSCIEYRYEDFHKLYEIFNVRWLFHKNVYRNPHCMAIGELLKVIVKRCPELKISNYPLSKIDSSCMEAFLNLTDENILKVVQNDQDGKFLENPNLLVRVDSWEFDEKSDRMIVVEDQLTSAGYEMPEDCCFSFYGDENKKTNILRDYSKIFNYYYFRINTIENIVS